MRDLLIGHRRSGGPRPWRAAGIGAGLCGAAAVVAWFIFERSVTYEPPGGQVSGTVSWQGKSTGLGREALAFRDARLTWRGGIAVLHVQGTGHEIGAGHGRLLGPAVDEAVLAAKPSLDAIAQGKGLWARLTHDLRVDWRLRFLDDGLSDSDRSVIAGMMRGAGPGDERYQDMVRAQAVWDLGKPTEASDGTGLTRSLAVVAAQESAVTNRVWVGHAFSAPGLSDGGEALRPVLTLARPQGGLAWASVGWPGNAGVVAGVNAKGLVILVNPARTREVRPTRSARPTLLLARSVLEQASTLDEAVRTLENTATLGAAAYLVVDGRAGKWAVVERGPSRAQLTRGSSPLVLGDSLTSAAFSADPENDRTRRLAPTAARVARVQQLVRAPLPAVDSLAAALRDRRAGDAARVPGHRGVPFDPAAQVVIIDPGLMVLWVADPEAAGRMRAFDLRHELEGVGDSPAPPPDLPADPSLEPEQLGHLVLARRELRAARRAMARGELATARELADRALARAPHLPEALELAGRLAGAAGDHAAARWLLQLWLDGGADDPDREQKVRSLLTTDRGF